MKSEIRNIKTVVCGGAFGDPNKDGQFIYGRRPDGKTFRCKAHWDNVKGMTIKSKGYSTEYTREEWLKIIGAPAHQQRTLANAILDQRAVKP